MSLTTNGKNIIDACAMHIVHGLLNRTITSVCVIACFFLFQSQTECVKLMQSKQTRAHTMTDPHTHTYKLG